MRPENIARVDFAGRPPAKSCLSFEETLMASATPPPLPPKHPFETNWYVQGPAQADGPFTGYVLKDKIAKREIGAETNIAELGANEWQRLADVPAFAALLPPALPDAAAAVAAGVEYAGFWIRLLAYIIDVIVLELFSLAIGAVLGIALAAGGMLHKVQPVTGADAIPHAFVAFFWIIGFALTIGYNVYFNSGTWQATPGKRLLGLHLVTLTGEPVSPWLAFGRWLAYLLDGLTLYVGFMMIGWTREKTGLHDIICGTRVVYGKL
jgi:uncharacterized RDD family membrane protein YckC